MREVVRSGTLAQLEEFRVNNQHIRVLNMDALEMLIEHCSQLKSIGYLKTCGFNRDLLQELKLRLSVRNLDLEVI
jgi:hypothetical protein